MSRLTTLLLLVLLITLSKTSFSQKKEDEDDVYGSKKNGDTKIKELLKRKDVLMVDDVDFIIDEFTSGTITLSSNETRSGKLRFNGSTVIFKDSTEGQTKRYGPKELKGFIAQSDTFKVYLDTGTVLQNPHQASFGVQHFVNGYLVKQMMYCKTFNLYKRQETLVERQPTFEPILFAQGWRKAYSALGNKFVRNIFYIKGRNEVQYVEVPKTKKAFKKTITKYTASDESLTKTINEDKLNYYDLEEILKTYNKDTNAR